MKKKLTPIAQKLRNNLTEVEKRLWKYLRNKQLDGLKFRRQQPVGPYIVDFINLEKRLIIEVDGGQHAKSIQKDLERDAWFQQQNFKVLRFWDNEVLENMEGVLESIKEKCSLSSLTPSTKGVEEITPPPTSSPVKGEDKHRGE